MKRLNKKGFTLIELLVVIVILVVIMSVAIPSVTSSIERSKNKQKQEAQELIVSAAELYYDTYRNDLKYDNTIKIKDLIDNRFLTANEAKDPFFEKRTLCGYILINRTGDFNYGYFSDTYFKFVELDTCGSECLDDNFCVSVKGGN